MTRCCTTSTWSRTATIRTGPSASAASVSSTTTTRGRKNRTARSARSSFCRRRPTASSRTGSGRGRLVSCGTEDRAAQHRGAEGSEDRRDRVLRRRADQRRQGVATALLDAAVEHLRTRGMTAAEAYPILGEVDPANWPQVNYVGPLSMYVKAGFDLVRLPGPLQLSPRAPPSTSRSFAANASGSPACPYSPPRNPP